MKKIIVKLDADGPSIANLGVYSSKEKANKVWRRFKRAMKGTVWQDSKKVLSAWYLDISFDGKPIR